MPRCRGRRCPTATAKRHRGSLRSLSSGCVTLGRKDDLVEFDPRGIGDQRQGRAVFYKAARRELDSEFFEQIFLAEDDRVSVERWLLAVRSFHHHDFPEPPRDQDRAAAKVDFEIVVGEDWPGKDARPRVAVQELALRIHLEAAPQAFLELIFARRRRAVEGGVLGCAVGPVEGVGIGEFDFGFGIAPRAVLAADDMPAVRLPGWPMELIAGLTALGNARIEDPFVAAEAG